MQAGEERQISDGRWGLRLFEQLRREALWLGAVQIMVVLLGH